ncbi:uncharacterized protein LOC135825124 [Sycon ciliatum]|uniref:uncharacterized protein LOC135825124 n=1 Tax=Sycon ciliatum TaxID=27933 RepID=UPI0020ABB9BB|eukprot:scpid87823/ scgid15456/ Serine/threonine-protein kinase SBK1; SH3-binding kinase 1
MAHAANPRREGVTEQPPRVGDQTTSEFPANYAGTSAGYQAYQHLLEMQKNEIRQLCVTSLDREFTVKGKMFENRKVRICRIEEDEGQRYKTVLKMGKFDLQNEAWKKKEMLSEIAVHRYVTMTGCPYIAQIHNTLYNFYDDYCFGFQVEYMRQGTVMENLSKLSYAGRLRVCRDVARGLKHIHSLHIVHADIKVHNVLVHIRADGQPMGKIIDFGASKVMGFKVKTGHSIGNTWQFTCPELANPEETRLVLAASVDIWSFGMMALSSLTPSYQMPWDRASDHNQDFKYFREHLDSSSERSSSRNPVPLKFLSQTPYNVLRPFVNYLVTNLLRMDPTRRFDMDRVIQELEGEIPGASTALEAMK